MRAAPHRPSRSGCFLIAAGLLVGTLAACGPGASSDGADDGDAFRFAFLRAPGMIVRLDSATGQTWFVGDSGEGGWTPLGRAPDPAGEPAAHDRFAIFRVGQRGESQGDRGNPASDLLRLDRATGRTWLVAPRDGAAWTVVGEPDAEAASIASTPAPSDPPSTAAAPETGAAAAPGAGIAKPAAPTLNLMPSERFGDSPAEIQKNVAVVVQALEKEGLPVEIKVWGARQLGVLDPDVAVPPLVEALEAEEPEVVVAAIESLQKLGATSTIPAILKLRDHPDARVRDAVASVVVEVR